MSKIYDYQVNNAKGEVVPMETYKGKVLLIVNTASKCGFTPQYKDLQTLYDGFNEKGLEILAFPCNQFANQEAGSDLEIQEFCQINYGLSFPVFGKIEVNGKGAHPLYQFLKSQKSGFMSSKIKWNFTKFLIDAEGKVVKRYAPNLSPLEIEEDIVSLLK